MVNQPHTIGRATEYETSPMHVAGTNRQQHRLAVPAADLERDFGFGRKVDVVSLHSLQPVFTDAVEKTRCGAVIQNLRRQSAARYCRSTSTEWPWLARMRRPSSLNAKRFLSLVATMCLR